MLPPKLALLALLFSQAGAAQSLVDNLNTTPWTSPAQGAPHDFSTHAGKVYFVADDPDFGDELYVTDGSAPGTAQVADVFPGPVGGDPQGLVELPNGTLLFVGETPAAGRELMRTDGTAAGTQLVLDLAPGKADAGIERLVVHGGEVFFFASDALGVRSLWKSDGTALGTVLVSDLQMGPGAGTTLGDELLVSIPAGLVFSSTEGVGAGFTWRLWITDGTGAGTLELASAMPGAELPPGPAFEHGGSVFLSADDGLHGEELWSTDGTVQGTGLLVDLAPGSGSAAPDEFVEYAGSLFFTADDGSLGRQLWATDGTAAGTVRVTDLQPGQVQEPVVLGGMLMHQATTTASGAELWGTLGQPGTSFLVADFAPGASSGAPEGMLEFAGEVYCSARTSATGRELFAVSFASFATRLVADIRPGPEDSLPGELTVSGAGLVFAARGPGVFGRELWSSDGTAAGTALLVDIGALGIDNNGSPDRPVSLGDRALYRVFDGVHGYELYSTDGTTAGTQLLKDFEPGAASGISNLSDEPRAWKGRAYFAASSPSDGDAIWSSDGTVAGTRLVTVPPAPNNGLWHVLGTLGGELYLTSSSNQIWATDGTLGNLRLVADKGTAVSLWGFTPNRMAVLGGKGYFSASTAAAGNELWVTDGTSAGTQLVVDLTPGSGDSLAGSPPVTFGGHVYFRASVGSTGDELWRTDGTAAGTALFADINPTGGSGISSMQVIGDRLVFSATDGTTGYQIDSTDGVSVQRVSNVDLPPMGNGIDSWLFTNGELVFTLFAKGNNPGSPASASQVLLASDGTVAGTSIVKTIDPTGAYSSTFLDLSSFARVGNRAVFKANDGPNGDELWVTDGSPVGTFRLTDVNPGGANSLPGHILRLGSRVLFQADDGHVGRELHQLPLDLLGGSVADSFGDGCIGSSGLPPKLEAKGSATIGSTLNFELHDAAPLAPAFLYFGLDFQRTDFGPCIGFVAQPALTTVVATDASGALTLPLTIPPNPGLIGFTTWWQFLVTDPGGAMLGVGALSPALEVILGS